jgi:outer membrane murein-binding lipoprotein Lpp
MDIGSTLLGGGGATILVTLVTTLVNRRKLGADTASVLTKAASGLVQDLSEQIDRLSAKVLALEAKVEGLEKREKSLTAELDASHDLNRHKDDLIAAMVREKTPQKEH